MRLRLISPLLSAYSVVFGFSTVYAAEPINLRAADFKKTQQQFHVVLPGAKAVSVAVSPDQLKLIQQHKDMRNITHFRMQQQYAGFDVIGGYAIVHSQKPMNGLLAADNKSTMNGIVYSGLKNELGNPDANFVKNGAAALQEFAEPYKGHEISQQSVTPVVYIDEENNAHWAYQVSIYVSYDDKIPEKPTAIIDAKTFKPFIQWNEIQTAFKDAKGKGFGGNSKMGKYEFGTDNYPYLDITRDAQAKLCAMENSGVKVIDMKHGYSDSITTAMQFRCADSADGIYWTGYQGDGYDTQTDNYSNGGYSPSNDALYDGYVIKRLYRDWYGLSVLANSDGSSMKLVMRVHYGQNYDNAFWDGTQMTFGDGSKHLFYPLVSLGVGAHEISHGFTKQHSNLRIYGEPGGMNEAFSDMAAQAAEMYAFGKNSWMIGPEITKEDSGYETLRYMDMPSRDGTSIDSADKYYPGLDVHYSCGVFNRLFYLIATSPDWTVRKAFDVMVKANMDYWIPYSTFKEAGCGVISAAKDLNYSVADVKAALQQVRVSYSACSL